MPGFNVIREINGKCFGGYMDTKNKILNAKQQISKNMKCDVSVFDQDRNIFLKSDATFFEILTFGNNAVVWADELMLGWCVENFSSTFARDIMDDDNLFAINDKLRSFGKKLSGEKIRYLHLFPEKTVETPGMFTYKLLRGNEIKALYGHCEFENALSLSNDKIVVAAYDNDKIAAVAGAHDYGNILWQINIDTLPEYRGKGLGTYLVKALTIEVEKLGMVACYTTWSANLASTKVALSTGFYPMWMGYWAQG